MFVLQASARVEMTRHRPTGNDLETAEAAPTARAEALAPSGTGGRGRNLRNLLQGSRNPSSLGVLRLLGEFNDFWRNDFRRRLIEQAHSFFSFTEKCTQHGPPVSSATIYSVGKNNLTNYLFLQNKNPDFGALFT